MKKGMSFLAVIFFLAKGAMAQLVADPATWTYEIKKKSAGQYEVIFHLSLQEGWHIWSLRPGGDGYEIVPSFAFDKQTVRTVGTIKESGKKVTTKMEGITGKVSYLTGKVDYIQIVQAKEHATITGTYEYQVCNDKMCLPPKHKDFKIEVK